MKQTVPVTNWQATSAYMQYLNTCGLLETPLSAFATLEATFDDSKTEGRLSLTATDFETKQVVVFTPEGSFEHYKVGQHDV